MTATEAEYPVAVLYPQTGALRVYASLELAKQHVAPTELARYALRSSLDLKRLYDHHRIEVLWGKLFDHMVWGMPKSALGPEPDESERTPPDCGTDLLADSLWGLMMRVGDRINTVSTTSGQDRYMYQLHHEKIRSLLYDAVAILAYPRQCKLIIQAFSDLKDEYVHEDRVRKMMSELVVYGGLKTKQDPFLILQFYRKRLIDDGLISRGGGGQEDAA